MDRHILAPINKEELAKLQAGDYVYITGTIYTARDAAHKRMIESLEKGELKNCFIEANICAGGCIKGPESKNWNKSFAKPKLRIEGQVVSHSPASKDILEQEIPLDKKFSDRSRTLKMPSEEELRDILRVIGKNKKTDELNCGACGYSSCRAKAIAVYQGKAEIGMCLPYAIAKAESMSNVVMDMTPNLVFIIDKELRICECNKIAQEFLGVSRDEALESYIFEYIETKDIEAVLETKEPIIQTISLDQMLILAAAQLCHRRGKSSGADHVTVIIHRGAVKLGQTTFRALT